MGGRSGEGPKPGNWAGGGGCGVERGGSRKAGRVWLGRRGTHPAGEWRLQGSWPERHARSPPLPLALRIPTELRATGSAATSWRGVTDGPPLGLPSSLRKDALGSQGAFCFGYREARLRPSASLHALGEERRSRRAPAGALGQERQGRTTADSGMRRVITFAPPGRPPWLPNSFSGQKLRAAWVRSVLCPRGWRHHLLRRPSPKFANNTQNTPSRCMTRKDAQKRWKTRLFSTSWGQKLCQSKSSNPPRVGTLGGVVLIAPPPPSAVPGGSHAVLGAEEASPPAPLPRRR